MVLPLPTSPCSRRFIGCGAAMSPAISPSTRFCAPVGLNGSMALISLAHAIVEFERDARHSSRLARFSATPHSSQKNSSKIRRNCAGGRKAFSSRRSLFGGGKCRCRAARSSGPAASGARGMWAAERPAIPASTVKHAMHQRSEHSWS